MIPAKSKSLHQCEMFRISSIYACRPDFLEVRLVKHFSWESFEHCFGVFYRLDGRLGLSNRTLGGLLFKHTYDATQARFDRIIKRRQAFELVDRAHEGIRMSGSQLLERYQRLLLKVKLSCTGHCMRIFLKKMRSICDSFRGQMVVSIGIRKQCCS